MQVEYELPLLPKTIITNNYLFLFRCHHHIPLPSVMIARFRWPISRAGASLEIVSSDFFLTSGTMGARSASFTDDMLHHFAAASATP